jgi:hypothetical protein
VDTNLPERIAALLHEDPDREWTLPDLVAALDDDPGYVEAHKALSSLRGAGRAIDRWSTNEGSWRQRWRAALAPGTQNE